MEGMEEIKFLIANIDFVLVLTFLQEVLLVKIIVA